MDMDIYACECNQRWKCQMMEATWRLKGGVEQLFVGIVARWGRGLWRDMLCANREARHERCRATFVVVLGVVLCGCQEGEHVKLDGVPPY